MRHEADRDGPRSRRHLILDAAIEQFGELGFEYTKWADIADQAGIGETGLYHYFESKAHCLLSIMSSELDRSWQRFLQATANQEDHSERLRLAVASAFDVTPREALSARILLNHLNLLSTKRRLESEEEERRRSRAVVRKIEDAWATLIMDGIGAGVFAERDPRQTALAILGLILSVWRWYRPSGDFTLDEVSEFIAESCARLVDPRLFEAVAGN